MKKQTAKKLAGRGLTAGELKHVVGGRGGSTIIPPKPTEEK